MTEVGSADVLVSVHVSQRSAFSVTCQPYQQSTLSSSFSAQRSALTTTLLPVQYSKLSSAQLTAGGLQHDTARRPLPAHLNSTLQHLDARQAAFVVALSFAHVLLFALKSRRPWLATTVSPVAVECCSCTTAGGGTSERFRQPIQPNMSVQHESPPSTAHHSQHSHHSGHTFPATPTDSASPFSTDSTTGAADTYDDPDASTALTVRVPLSASASPLSSTPSPSVMPAQPAQPSLNVSPAAFPSSSAAVSSSAVAPSTTAPPSQLHSQSTPFSSSSAAVIPSTSSTSAASSSSTSPAMTAIERLRPSLQMYRNQVAGHSPLFWHSGTICKPLIPAEYTFYAQLEEQMAAFMPYVPKFYGLLDLEQLTEEMASSLLTEPTSSSAAVSTTATQRGGSTETKNDSEGSVKHRKDGAGSQSDGKQQRSNDDDSSSEQSRTFTQSPPASNSVHSPSESSMTANSSAGRIYNKWYMEHTHTSTQLHSCLSMRLYRQPTNSTCSDAGLLTRPLSTCVAGCRVAVCRAVKCQLRKPGVTKSRIQYIVLEDLTYAYAKPCILDLKVGTRQHSDTEPPSKIASKTARCLHTTSHAIGLRLCGMQVYHSVADMYQYRDKYWGRALDVDGFTRAMRDYFWDGERIVEQVVRAFVARLERMRRAVMLWTKGRRFYSSSLLLVYEGDKNSRAGGSEQEAASPASLSSAASASGELKKPSTLRQGSESSLTSTGSGFFSPLPSPATHASPSSSSSSTGHQPLTATASTASLSTRDGTKASPLTSSSLSSSHNHPASLSSSVPSMSNVPITRATLPASFSSATLSSTFHSTQSNTSSASTSGSVSSASAGSAPLSSSSSPLSAPIKLYSHKRKTTHAQAMVLARQRGSIDIRLIDFAHTSLVGEAAVAGGVVESGSPDEVDSGLLFGLDTLLELLRAILEEELDTHGAEKQQQRATAQQSEEDVDKDNQSDEAVENGTGARVAVVADTVAIRASSDGAVASSASVLSNADLLSA